MLSWCLFIKKRNAMWYGNENIKYTPDKQYSKMVVNVNYCEPMPSATIWSILFLTGCTAMIKHAGKAIAIIFKVQISDMGGCLTICCNMQCVMDLPTFVLNHVWTIAIIVQIMLIFSVQEVCELCVLFFSEYYVQKC